MNLVNESFSVGIFLFTALNLARFFTLSISFLVSGTTIDLSLLQPMMIVNEKVMYAM